MTYIKNLIKKKIAKLNLLKTVTIEVGGWGRGGTILTFLGKSLLFISDRMVLNVV